MSAGQRLLLLQGSRVWLAGALVVVLAISGFFFYKSRQPFDPGVDVTTFTTAEELEDYYKNLSEVYAKDTYGGSTPEETLELFIDALKKGDTNLAAKYFIPEKQKEEAQKLKIGTESGGVSLLISVLGRPKVGDEFSEGRYRFVTYDESNTAEFQFDLIFNSKTNVWKIEDL